MKSTYSRRQVLGGLVILAGGGCVKQDNNEIGEDIADIDQTRLHSKHTSTSIQDIQTALKRWKGPVCIAGGRYSMGGQTREANSLQLDMTGMDTLVWIDVQNKTVRVQAGMRWRQLQELLDPLNLSVKVMQSYSNFSIGGSVSVNCHGRYIGQGSIASTIRAIQMMTVDGDLLELSRTQKPELFAAAIGGYGGLGIITEVELELAQNTRIKRYAERVALEDYPEWFNAHVLENKLAILHNADLTPPHFDSPLAITWQSTQDPLTDQTRLTQAGSKYSRDQNLIWSATEMPGGDQMREHYMTDKILSEPKVIWRNREASLDVASLEPRTRLMSTYLLQEYFIPVEAFGSFLTAMRKILARHKPNMVNISIRHAPKDNTSLLRWAEQDVFCFVLYHKQRQFPWSEDETGRWTRELVAAALDHKGRHYLPYRLHATRSQVRQGYPGSEAWIALKQNMDPNMRLRNLLLDKYFLPERLIF